MCAVTYIRIVSMEHNNNSFDSRGGGVSICGKLECFSFVVSDREGNEVDLWVLVMSLWIRRVVLVLLGIKDRVHFLCLRPLYVSLIW